MKFEDELVKIVVDKDCKRIQTIQRKNFEKLNKMLTRDKELDIFYKKVLEEKTLDNLS